MAQSTGLVLTGAAISFSNEWFQTGEVNYRIPVAGLGAALLMAGVERVSRPAAIGISSIFLVSVILTPFNGKSPFETLDAVATGQPVRGPSLKGK